MRYQGSANYQTWAISLWLNNDKDLHDMGLDMAREGNKTDTPRTRTAVALKEYTDSVNPLQDETGVFSDLINGVISCVNWYEIADGFLEVVNYAEDAFTCGCGQVCKPQDGRLWKGIQYCPDCESRLYDSGEIPEGNGGNRP